MNRKEKKKLSSIVSGLYLIVCLSLFWLVFKSTNFYIYFGIAITTPIVERIVYSIIPEKKRKKNVKKQSKTTTSRLATSKQLRSDNEIINSKLQDLSWREFERLCFLYFNAKGNKARETSEGADGGVDLIIYNKEDKSDEAVQIKHYLRSGNKITVTQIRELNTAKRNHNCILAMFITTSSFTNDALIEAHKYHITCRDINWVENKIVRWQEQMRQSKKRLS